VDLFRKDYGGRRLALADNTGGRKGNGDNIGDMCATGRKGSSSRRVVEREAGSWVSCSGDLPIQVAWLAGVVASVDFPMFLSSGLQRGLLR